jgi:hypothetical protein
MSREFEFVDKNFEIVDKRFELVDKKFDALNAKLGRIKDNVMVVITHLSSSASINSRLEPSLIQVMSPMVLTEKAIEILKESGFIAVMNNPQKRRSILHEVSTQNPQTKLDVESYAVIATSVFLEKDFMNPVKAYLYNNPNIRETFAVLAGIYIRDEFFKDHPEIIE